jgi:hypothetical protein
MVEPVAMGEVDLVVSSVDILVDPVAEVGAMVELLAADVVVQWL